MTGDLIYRLASKHLGEPFQFGIKVPKNNPTYKGPWDCCEFASWLVYQVSGKLYGCFIDNGKHYDVDACAGYWKIDAESLGNIISVEEAACTVGSVVMRFAYEGRVGHIAISDGRGNTIEAYNTKDGIRRAVISGRRWDYGVLVPWLTYNTLSPVVVEQPDYPIYRYTNPQMIDPLIGRLQAALTSAGYDTLGIDNVFGMNTLRAVVKYQNEKGLVVDGEVGEETARILGIKIGKLITATNKPYQKNGQNTYSY